jgi:hypothetical protein
VPFYADTLEAGTPREFAAIAKERKDRGLTWIKVDVGTDLLRGNQARSWNPPTSTPSSRTNACRLRSLETN